jgi:hypothetical protein
MVAVALAVTLEWVAQALPEALLLGLTAQEALAAEVAQRDFMGEAVEG